MAASTAAMFFQVSGKTAEQHYAQNYLTCQHTPQISLYTDLGDDDKYKPHSYYETCQIHDKYAACHSKPL
jgi:hypothetical protein